MFFGVLKVILILVLLFGNVFMLFVDNWKYKKNFIMGLMVIGLFIHWTASLSVLIFWGFFYLIGKIKKFDNTMKEIKKVFSDFIEEWRNGRKNNV